ncbi:MAG: PQQ-binding-like beta-propeller repeat protein [Micromonosporaceae bacterium]|nr:PQQ-binding-like beta-propeller repeat protein [Micromonosporaceae bacterium]
MADERYGPVPPPPPLPPPAGSPVTPPDPWSPPPSPGTPGAAEPAWQSPAGGWSAGTGQPPAPGQALGPGQPPAPGDRRRLPRWLVMIAVATATASVISFAAVLLWPASESGPHAPLDFRRFTSVARIDFATASRTTLTAVRGDRGYAASEQDGDLHVVAFEVATGAQSWQRTITGAPQWSRIVATQGGLLVLAYEPDPTIPRRMFVLDPETGEERWHQDVRGDDQLFFLRDALGWLDRDRGELRGLDLATGGDRWRVDLPEGEPTVLPVTSDADLARPTDLRGDPSPGAGDNRIVVVAPDRSVRVIDGDDGRIVSERDNLAGPDDLLLAYQGRLFIAAAEPGYRLDSYDLAALSEVSQAHYEAPDAERYPDQLAACGGRVCLLETVSFDRDTTELVAVDAVDGGELWRAPAAGAEQLLGVGEWVAAAANVDFEPSVVVYDRAGEPVLEREGLVVRLNDSNLLVLTGIGAITGGVSVAGAAIEGWDGDPFEVGRLPEGVLEQECSWNERHLVCPDRSGVDIWQFAVD